MKNIWLPIKTAPRDGTEVLLSNDVFGVVDVGYYSESFNSWNFGPYEPTHWMDKPVAPKLKTVTK